MSEKNATVVVDLGFSSAKYMFNGKKGRVPSAFRSKFGGYNARAREPLIYPNEIICPYTLRQMA